MPKNTENKKQQNSDIISRKLSILIEINQAISSTLDLNESLTSTLKILQNSYHIKSGAIFIQYEQDQTFRMAASIGYKKSIAKVIYKLGEGLTGRIAETGKPIVVPQVSKEPLYLNRLSAWDPKRDREQTFIGVPIISGYKTLGVLVVNLSFNLKREYDSVKKFFVLVASDSSVLFRMADPG